MSRLTTTETVVLPVELSELGKKMSEAAVRVIGLWPSPFVIRVLIALKLKGVEFEFVEEVVGRKSELLLRSNPVHKKIPVLLHHGKPISESLIIVQYIDEVWSSGAPAFLPVDAHARAVQRFWAQYVDDKLPWAIRILKGTDDGGMEQAAGQLSAALQLLEEAFAQLSQGKRYFGGDSVGYLDIALVSHVGWVKAVEKIAGVTLLDKAKVPNLVAWADRLCAHPAVVDAIPDADKFVEFSVTYGSFSKPINAPAK
ncbi:glutathione transferase31 [Zea mays]|uniref:glutathione transferase n=2 Tax=Zea mays TaxID=4577 RepID=A0A1D6JMZ6_MAIZE|nr:glutathione transferase31 [Zea mays]ONL93420.1 glutathione transferase31 [Zea mays]|eukprot:NP_001266752.2 glutathione transferase31 [Zea mays]